MDSIPDLIWQSGFQDQYSATKLISVGDVNGDGYEDIILREHYPQMLESHAAGAFGIGDVNSDGYEDMIYRTSANLDYTKMRLGGPSVIKLRGIPQCLVLIALSNCITSENKLWLYLL